MTLPSLYVLADEYRQVADRLSDTDLDPQTIADTLEGMTGDIEIKVTNVAMFVRNLEATADQIKAAETQMATRRKSIESKAEHIREYLKSNMISTGITKIECPYFKISVRDNPQSVVIDSLNSIPSIYMRHPEPPPMEPNKKLISDAIKAGLEVPGVHLSRTQRLEIK